MGKTTISTRVVVFCALASALCGLGACSRLMGGLVGTRIVVRSSRQSLREQVLGSYEELGEEVFLLAGVRAVDPVTGKPSPPPLMSESERRALEARRSMEFNRDDVLRFKRLAYVGEDRQGLLVFFEDRKEKLRRGDPWLFGLVRDIAEEENRDRECIMKRIAETTPELGGEEGPRTVRQILAEMYRRQAEPGMKVQLSDGTWVTKREGEPGD